MRKEQREEDRLSAEIQAKRESTKEPSLFEMVWSGLCPLFKFLGRVKGLIR
jgi:hypothetical protein